MMINVGCRDKPQHSVFNGDIFLPSDPVWPIVPYLILGAWGNSRDKCPSADTTLELLKYVMRPSDFVPWNWDEISFHLPKLLYTISDAKVFSVNIHYSFKIEPYFFCITKMLPYINGNMQIHWYLWCFQGISHQGILFGFKSKDKDFYGKWASITHFVWSHTMCAMIQVFAMILLTHWGRVTHICVSNLTITGPDNGLSPGRRQDIIWINAGILLIGPLGTNFNEISIEINTFSFKKMHLKMSSGKWQPFCLGLNVLTITQYCDS